MSLSSSSSTAKRKLDDSDDAVSPQNPTKMRKDVSSSPSSNSTGAVSFDTQSPPRDSKRIQFFVRMLSDHTLVLQASPGDTIESIHGKIQSITGIPIREQRLIYRGKQLQCEQTLAQCKVQNDAGLHLVGRMRSTGHPKAWQLINDLVSFVFYLGRNNPPQPPQSKTIKSILLEFLSMSPVRDAVHSFANLQDYSFSHLQVFNALSAPSALVMLYMSSHAPNREAAQDAIRSFISNGKTVLPKPAYHQFVPIVLEFCRLLNKTKGIRDRLFSFCRSSLGTMLEYVRGKKGAIGLCDVFPFVSELAVKLSSDLRLIMDSFTTEGPSDGEVNDFALLLSYVKHEIKGDSGFCGPVEVPLPKKLSGLPLRNANEITILHGIFVDLLSKLERCLMKIEEHVGSEMKQNNVILPSGANHFLAILKELHGISKLYRGCYDIFWEALKRRKHALCYLIVNCTKRKENHWWITENKEVTNFEARRHLAMFMLPDLKDEYDELHEMLIDRSHLLEESFEYVAHAEASSLRAGLFMEFKNEEATGPGVLREWFSMVCQAIFNPQNALFAPCPNDCRRFFPNPASKVDPLHLEYFTFSGRVIALALMHKVQVGVLFDRVFFLQLGGQTITLEDIRDADPYLYRGCKQILEMDPDLIDQDVLGLTFVDEIEELGTKKVVELCPDGGNVVVNSANRQHYVDSLIKKRFVTAIAEQVEHFAQGFTDVMSCSHLQRLFFQLLELEDLDWMLHGSRNEISVDDWKAHTEYYGFKETDAQISWFWEAVGRMTPEQKKVLLYFWTSIKYLPIEGFRGLASRLYIYKTIEPFDHLPTSHTCFYRLCFPAYPSSTIMQARLRLVTQDHVGCSFGTW